MKTIMNKNLKIALIGVYPPPYGGISVHIQRLNEQLKKKGFECIIYDLFGKRGIIQKNVKFVKNSKVWMLKYFLGAKEDIVHYHGGELKSLYFLMILVLFSLFSVVRKKNVIFTIHSFKHNIHNINLLYRFIFWMVKKADICFIAIGPQIKKKIMSLGIEPKNIEVIPSFIPPAIREQDIAEIPNEIWDFMDNHSPVISANAAIISFYNNTDLYGIDMCIDLCANLRQSHPDIGFVFCLPDVNNSVYFEKMKQRIIEKDLENIFLFVTKQHQLYPIIRRSNVFVRPTNTDGYGVSIAEAIYLKVPAVASDVCPRPAGTILFKSRDIEGFTSKVKEVLNNYGQEVAKLENIKNINGADKIIEMYRRIGMGRQQ